MWFKLTGLKQIKEGSVKIDLLLDVEGETDVRNALNKYYGIVILGMKKFSEEKTTFGSIEFKTNIKDIKNVVEGIINLPQIEEAYEFLVEKMGLEIIYVNSLIKPLSREKIQAIIENFTKKLQQKKVEEKEKKDIESHKKSQAVDTKKLKEFRDIISSTVKEANEIIEKSTGIVTPMMIKELKDNLDELIKLRMGTNVEKMGFLFSKVLRIMEKIELIYIDHLKNEEKNNLKKELISDLDLITEYEKYKKAQKVSKIQNNPLGKSVTDMYYEFLGKPGIYITIFYKEFKLRLGSIEYVAFHSVNLLELAFISILIQISLMILYNISMNSDKSLQDHYSIMWQFGIAGLILFFLKFLLKQNIVIIIIVYVLLIVFFKILKNFILVNFAF